MTKFTALIVLSKCSPLSLKPYMINLLVNDGWAGSSESPIDLLFCTVALAKLHCIRYGPRVSRTAEPPLLSLITTESFSNIYFVLFFYQKYTLIINFVLEKENFLLIKIILIL
jgi:hypothetical protein